MLVEMGCITLGVPVGHLFRRRRMVVLAADRALTWLVWLLLFLLGVTIGYDSQLMGRLGALGGKALLIWVCALAGSLAGAWLLGRWLGFMPPRPERAGTGAARKNALRAVGSSLIVLILFCAGVASGLLALLPEELTRGEAVLWTLYVQLFVAGMCIGFSLHSLKILTELRAKALLIPVMVALGSLAGGVAAWTMLADMPLRHVLAVSGGMSYYSLSSVLLSRMADAELGSISLLANMAREIGTLILAPLFQRLAGPFGPLASGGAAAMDSCLPVIARESGERIAILGVFSGVGLTLFVPAWISALFSF